MRRTRTYAVLGVALGLTLTACGGGGHGSPHADKDPTTPPPFVSPGADLDHMDVAARGPVTIRGATAGGTVTVLTHAGLRGSLDPTAASAPDLRSILSGLVIRSLNQYRYDPVTKQMFLVPDLATNLGMHNDDYTRWAYTVRHGVRFEDGTPVTAHDVARGIRRCLRTRLFPTSPCVGVPIRAVTTEPHGVVVVHFTRPYPDLPYLAALPALGPIPLGGRADPATYARQPLATGPYRVGSYRPGHRLVLVRNAQWDPKTDPGRTQYPTEYDVRAGLSSHRIAHALLADRGRARTTLTYDDLPPGPWLDSKSLSRRLVEGATPCTTYLAPDNQVITNPAVRRALVWAYPYRAMLRLKGLTPGVTAVPATNVLPPGIPGRRSIDVRGHRGFATQPRVARRMLARAHALGTRLRFSYARNDPASVRASDVLVRSLRASGFRPDPVPVSADFVPGRTTVDLPVDLRTRTWCGAWPAGSAWLVPLYEPSSSADAEYFANRYVDRRIEAIRRGPLEEQFQWWSGLDRTVLRRWQPIVPVWYDGVAMAHGSAIQGMADDTVTGMPAWPDLWVKQ